VAEYNNAYMLTTSDYYLAFSNAANFTLFNNYPKDPGSNTSNRPQFVGTQTAESLLHVGSGRRLSAVLNVEDSEPSEPMLYQSFLTTPSAAALSPRLQFTNGQARSGTLADPLNATVQYSLAQILTDANGIAQVSVKAVAAGFPTLRFFIQDGQQQPTVPFSFNYTDAYTDFLAPLRVLPQEPEMLKDFIDCWNRVCTQDDASVRIWKEFIFPRILQPFYYLYPIMNKFMPLNSLQRIEGAINQFIVLISKDYQEESTLAMPITRDLPQSRRRVLEIWAQDLVSKGYPPIPLKLNDYPHG